VKNPKQAVAEYVYHSVWNLLLKSEQTKPSIDPTLLCLENTPSYKSWRAISSFCSSFALLSWSEIK
jgi:hypothetical protein